MVSFPSEEVLLARGKYSTLSRARREQLETVQRTIQAMMTAAQQALRDCEARPPSNLEPLVTISKMLNTATKARDELISLSNEMEELYPLAWSSGEPRGEK